MAPPQLRAQPSIRNTSPPPKFVKRLYRPKHVKSLPPIEAPPAKSAAPPPSLAVLRWRLANERVKAVLRMAEPMTGKWGWLRAADLGTKVGRVVPPSRALRASSYERFLGLDAADESPREPAPTRCISRPRSHRSEDRSSLPPVTTWSAWYGMQGGAVTAAWQGTQAPPQRSSISCCGTVWHAAAEHRAPLHVPRPGSRAMERKYVICSR